MANSYPILKMENISQVLLFSKYCLTLFFVCLIVLLEKILWIQDAVRMQFLLSHLFKTTLVTQLTKSQRAICFSIFSPFFFLFFFFVFDGVYLHLLKYIQSTLKRNIMLLHSWGIFLTGKLENKILSIFYLLQFKQKQTKLHFSQEQRSSHF